LSSVYYSCNKARDDQVVEQCAHAVNRNSSKVKEQQEQIKIESTTKQDSISSDSQELIENIQFKKNR
jgi:hypothetical protein